MEGNRDIVENLLGELIRNALDAVQDVPKPAITITCAAAKDTVEIDVRDNGVGMTEEMLAKAFQPFHTGHITGRMGLGLAYVHRAVGIHAGTVNIQSAEGTGTRVHLTFPLARRPGSGNGASE
jgi:signal transduction histidine kinase